LTGQAQIPELNIEPDPHSINRGDVFTAYFRVRKQMEMLRKKPQEVELNIAEMREAGEGAWEELSARVQIAWDSMEEALKSAQSRFK
jgi:hypothetical protein